MSLISTTTKLIIALAAVLISIILKYPNPELDWKRIEDLAYNYSATAKSSRPTAPPLQDVTIVITGATSGIGKGLSCTLYKLGATIIAIGRSNTKLTLLEQELMTNCTTATTTTRENKKKKRIISILSDFSDLESVSKASNTILSSKIKSIDFLINNAGTNCKQPLSTLINNETSFVTVQGYNRCFGVNYLSHFLLSEKLIPLLEKSNKNSPRMIQVSSSAHWLSDGTELQILEGNNNDSSPLASQDNINAPIFYQYPSSKLAQILHGRSLSKKLQKRHQQSSKIKVISICPGLVHTNIAATIKLYQKRSELFGYSSNGYGLSSIINALFRPNIGEEKTDFIYNFKSPIANGNKWNHNVRLRRNFIKISRIFVPIIQKFFYVDLGIYNSSPESYNDTLQNDLYEWSLNAVSQWL